MLPFLTLTIAVQAHLVWIPFKRLIQIQQADPSPVHALGRRIPWRWGRALESQITQSRNLYQAPANGKNHGRPLYKPSGAPGNGMPTKGLSGLSPAISSAIFWP